MKNRASPTVIKIRTRYGCVHMFVFVCVCLCECVSVHVGAVCMCYWREILKIVTGDVMQTW